MLSPARAAATDSGAVSTAVIPGFYLTDEVSLFRLGCRLRTPGRGVLVELEDCKTLDLILLPMSELRSKHLRRVRHAGPAAGRPSA